MGTRADFYIRKEKELTWLGSIAWDGYEIGNIGKATSEKSYMNRLSKFLAEREDATYPKDGWPWPWKNSKLTDEIWVWDCDTNSIWRGWKDTGNYDDAATPYLFYKGYKQQGIGENYEEADVPDSESWLMPDMSDKSNVTMGKRSGLIVISL